MYFLVILICLLANYLWLKDVDRFDDGWFFRFRRRVDAATASQVSSSSGAWFVPVVIIYLLPVAVLLALLWLVAERALGLPTMLLHILVLLVALDRIQPGKMAAEFLAYWRRADEQGARAYLEEVLPGGVDLEREIDAASSLPDFFARQLLYRAFERMFVMFFWYLLAGPLAVLFAYISYQMRDSHDAGHSQQTVSFIANVIAVLEWIPLRLLMLTFSLAGNFVQCFEDMKGGFWDLSPDSNNAETLYSSAGCALSGLVQKIDPDQQGAGTASAEENEIRALLALLERSQAIWLIGLALVTVFGMQF